MPSNSILFHIHHVARPERIEHILLALSDDQSFDAESVRLYLGENGYSITHDAARRSLDMGSKLGLFTKSDRASYALTARGQACRNLARFRHDVYCDVMHFLLFASWELGKHQDYWSWSYRRVCEIFWRDSPSIQARKVIFGQLAVEAAKSFPDLVPVVGTETVGAVSNWLKELTPPFLTLEDGKLIASQEREWFSAELALLAISYLYAARGVADQTPILLDRPTVELLCPLCLTSVERILAMIDIAARTFSMLHIHTGEWGSSVILDRAVDISVLV